MDWEWETIHNFGSLRERDSFVAWMRGQSRMSQKVASIWRSLLDVACWH
jgi:hypothetical protein